MSADNQPGQTGAPDPAAGAELSIPKHRFDEVNAELRRLRDEVSMKDQLYMQERQQQANQRQQPQAPAMSAEDVGLDPQTFKAVQAVAERIAEGKISRERQIFESQVGILASRTEKAELLASKGSDKARYMPDIQRMQQEHFGRTGGFLPAEIALTMLQDKEKDARIAQLEAKLSAQANGTQLPAASTNSLPSQQPYSSAPPASGTRQMPNGGAPAQAAPPAGTGFGDLSLEQMEAALEAQFKSGTRL